MMIPMKAFTFPALVLAALSIWTAAAQTRISTIPPLPGKNARSLQVPPYQSFCWFAADRGRWSFVNWKIHFFIVSSSRMLCGATSST